MIGIIGGMGPRAGLDLAAKVVDETLAVRDQDHLDLVMLSQPARITDRTDFLLGQASVNPGHAIARIARTLAEAGASVVGIACNTAHSPAIFDVVRDVVRDEAPGLRLLHMIDETVELLRAEWPSRARVGVLATPGTMRLALYQDALARRGFVALVPSPATQDHVMRAIYSPEHGIKAHSPVSAVARASVERAIEELIEAGSETVILGCTELPLAVPGSTFLGVPLVDPTRILARGLVRALCPARLRPSPWTYALVAEHQAFA